MIDAVPRPAGDLFDHGAFWTDSLVRALLARAFVAGRGRAEAEEAFATMLLADQESLQELGLQNTIALHATDGMVPDAGLLEPSLINDPRIVAITMAIALISILMIVLRCAHPPAAATVLLAAMGFFETEVQTLGLVIAVALRVLEAFLINRILGGLPPHLAC